MCGIVPARDSGADDLRPLSGEPLGVNACGAAGLSVTAVAMEESALTTALDRADQALQRIERALAGRQPSPVRDEELRAKVREVVEELDELIREAAA